MMMKSSQFLAGTALCALMVAPLPAAAGGWKPAGAEAPLLLTQAEESGEAAPEGDCPPGSTLHEGGCVVLEDAPAEPEAETPAEPEAPEAEPVEPEEAVPAEPEAEAPAPEAEPVEPAEPEAAPAEPAPEAAPEEAPSEAAPQAEEPPEEEPAAEEQPAEEQPPAEADEAQEAPAEEAETLQEPAETECPPGMELSAAGECVAVQEEALPEEAPAEESPQEQIPAEEAPEEAAPAEEQPAEDQPAEEAEPAEPAPAEEAVPEEAQEPEEAPDEEAAPEDAAPVPDSQKEEAADEEQPTEPTDEEAAEPEAGEPAEEQAAEEAPAPESDAQAQEDVIDPEEMREEIRELVEQEGQRIELGQTPEDRRIRRLEIFQPREEARVVREYNDNRTIIEINNRIIIESSDYDRIVRRGDTVWYEELRGGRVREVVERADGTRIITVRNRYGDVIRRVRVTPDGRQYVLVYMPERRFDDVRVFEDPAHGLPPLRLRIPMDRYVLEATRQYEPRRYHTFLAQPPVEPVRRLYSLEEVRYSARVRDMMPRIDLETIEFEFGSARVEESEVADLQALSQAMLDILEENPAETFLIEGHTDAVGSDTANLVLSDRRADAVARALTNVFEVPPENLVTQGYGEQYLKVNTQEPERTNRRVAVRRITPLVAPMASR